MFTYHCANGIFKALQADSKLMTQPLMEPFMLLTSGNQKNPNKKKGEQQSGQGEMEGDVSPPTYPVHVKRLCKRLLFFRWLCLQDGLIGNYGVCACM